MCCTEGVVEKRMSAKWVCREEEFCAKDSTLILCILVRFISAWIYFSSVLYNTLGLSGVHLLM